MTTAFIASALVVLAVVDGALAGFRSSLGRTGLIDHRRDDRRGAARGAALVVLLLAPVAAVAGLDAASRRGSVSVYDYAGSAMLACYLPYAVVVLLALLGYLLLTWRKRYLAVAVILGPLTFVRPALALLGAAFAVVVSHDRTVAALACAAVVAVLAVEPLAGRLWYSERR